MLKKILSNKIVLICCIVLIVGIVFCLVTSRDSEDNQKEDHQIEQEETEKEDAEQEGTKQENTGLEIKEDVDDVVDSIDGSGSWDTTPNNHEQKTDDDTVKNDNTADDSNEETEQENILEDDKEWSSIG